MHSLEVIVARNSKAHEDWVAAGRPVEPSSVGYAVHNLGGGIIEVEQPNGPTLHINASNPLEDEELVNFHRTFSGPKSVAFQVESIASQHRRILVSSGAWGDIYAESQAKYAAQEQAQQVQQRRLAA